MLRKRTKSGFIRGQHCIFVKDNKAGRKFIQSYFNVSPSKLHKAR